MPNLNKWCRISTLPRLCSDRTLCEWIEYKDSMSQRLRTQGELNVELLKSHIASPLNTESQKLHQPRKMYGLIREVILTVNDVPWIYGRSVFPQDVLRGKYKKFAWLKNTALGDFLFKQKPLRRSEFEVNLLSPTSRLHRIINENIEIKQNCVARRSVFTLNTGSFLLTEVFLPDMIIDE